jgi:hypothetical protein
MASHPGIARVFAATSWSDRGGGDGAVEVEKRDAILRLLLVLRVVPYKAMAGWS